MGKKPAIRFEEYTEDWEPQKLGEISDIVGGGTPNTAIPKYWNGDIDWYAPAEIDDQIFLFSSQKKITEQGYINSSAKMLPEGTVLFTSRAGIGKTAILAIPGCTNQGFQSIVPHKGELDSYFIFSRTEELKQYGETTGAGSTFVEVSGKQMENMELMMPSTIEEQQAIGNFFHHLDRLITLHQSNYEKMVATKMSMLDKLFPQDDDKVPVIRFEGFVGDWEKKPLSAIVIPYSDPVEVPHDGYERLGIRSHGKGVFHEYVEAGKEITTAQLHRVAAHNLIVNITFAWEHAVAVTCDSDAGKLVSHRFPQFSMADGIHDQFLKYLILDARFRHHLLLSSPGGAGRNRVLKIPEMLEYEMMIPDIEEQKQIAGYLNSLDDLIELYQIRVEKLKNIKAACLQGMFV